MQEKDPNSSPVGLYKDPESGNYMGAIEEAQAAAMIRAGYKLVDSGRDAAILSQAEIDAKYETASGGATYDPATEQDTSSKKGK